MHSFLRSVLFSCCFFIITAARSQLISFSVKNEPLEKIFLLIEQQSGYNFIYTEEMMQVSRPVSLTVSAQPILLVLEKCFAQQPLQFTIDGKHVVVKEKKIFNTLRPLSGKVVTDESEPVAGITVSIPQMNLQAATDADGKFHFEDVMINASLQVTGAEIAPVQLSTKGVAFLTVVVQKKVGLLDGPIVIAYGKTTKRATLGSIGKVSKEEVARQPVSNFSGALTGRISGLQVTQGSGVPGAPFTFRIRGQNSIASGNDPLFVVDGIPYPSTSLSNITTGSQLSSPLNWINISDIESIEVLKDAEATAIYGSRGANGVVLVTTRRGTKGDLQVRANVQAGGGKVARFMDLLETPAYLQMRREAFQNDGIMPTIDNARDLLVYDSTKNTDWQKELFGRTMHQFDSRVELAGGTGPTQFLAAVTYRKETMVVPVREFGEQKIGAQFSLQHHTSNQRISFSLQSSLMKTRLLVPQNSPVVGVTLPPNMPDPRNPDGSLYWDPYWGNALQPLLRPTRSQSDNFLTSAAVSAKLVKGLEAKVSFGYNWITLAERSRVPSSSWNPAFNAVSSASFGNTTWQNIIVEPQITYHHSWQKIHANILAGASVQDNRQRGIQQTGSGYTSEELMGSLQAASTVTTNNETSVRYRYIGLFSRFHMDWDNTYYLSLTARRDGSSRYAPLNRFSNFGSVGAGWIFWKKGAKSRFLSFGKLRASMGVTGNDQIGDYKYLDTYSSYLHRYQGVVPFVPNQLFSPHYGWERVTKREIGLDAGFFRDRLLLTVNYYNNTTDNQLVSYGLPATTGFTGVLQNLPAKVRNYGWEIEITAIPIKSKHIEWSFAFNLSIPRNRLVRFDNLASSSYANSYVVGEPLLISKRYALTGVDPTTGLYAFTDYNSDGQYTSADRQSIVFTGQQFFGGIQQNVTWKKWGAGFMLQFVRQRYAGNYLNSFDMPGTLANQPALVMARWNKIGDNSSIQKFSTGAGGSFTAFNRLVGSDGAFDDASFIRLKNLYLSWQFKSFASIQLAGQNLLTFTRFANLDPESRAFMPPLRVLTASVQVKL